eukprot:6465808-Amphidinium_carterae.2
MQASVCSWPTANSALQTHTLWIRAQVSVNVKQVRYEIAGESPHAQAKGSVCPIFEKEKPWNEKTLEL